MSPLQTIHYLPDDQKGKDHWMEWHPKNSTYDHPDGKVPPGFGIQYDVSMDHKW